MKLKTLSTEAVAELYIYQLRKDEKKPPKGLLPPILHTYLQRKNIYEDQNLIFSSISLLLKMGMITLVDNYGASISLYDSDSEQTIDNFDEKNVKSMVRQYALTPKGRHFVDSKQKVDLQKAQEIKERNKKWKERGITAIISIIVFILCQLFMKWLQK